MVGLPASRTEERAHSDYHDPGSRYRSLLSGAVVTETISHGRASGAWIFQAIQRRDFPIIQAGVVVLGITFTA